MILWYQKIIATWTGLVLQQGLYLAIAWGVFNVLTCIGSAQGMAMTAFGFVGFQAKMQMFFIMILLPTKFLCLKYLSPSAMVFDLSLIYAVEILIFEKKIMSYQRKKLN